VSRRGLLLAAALGLALAAPRPARAYVRARAQQSDLPSFWDASCAIVTIYLNGFTGMSADEVAKSIGAAAHAWSPEVVTCPGPGDAGAGHPSFEIIPQLAGAGPAPSVGPDGRNIVVFQTQTWAYGDAIALTSRNTDPSGRIFDADIEVNATGAVTWANLDPGATAQHVSGSIDLQTAITHEFGHFLGLAHTCYHDGFDPPPRPVDDQGNPSPDCTDDTIPQAAAVMWYQVEPDSTFKRVIAQDDARGVCAIYPPDAVLPACAANFPDDGCGCRAGAGDGPAGPAAALLALAALLSVRRRAR
jgi:MYXO-CTERM domain-containing protein